MARVHDDRVGEEEEIVGCRLGDVAIAIDPDFLIDVDAIRGQTVERIAKNDAFFRSIDDPVGAFAASSDSPLAKQGDDNVGARSAVKDHALRAG